VQIERRQGIAAGDDPLDAGQRGHQARQRRLDVALFETGTVFATPLEGARLPLRPLREPHPPILVGADTEAAITSINVVGLDYYLMKPWDPPSENLYPILDDLLEGFKIFLLHHVPLILVLVVCFAFFFKVDGDPGWYGVGGIEVATTPVGDRHVAAELERRGWALGGEQSGHLIYLRDHVSGDGLAAALLLCAALHGRPLSEAAAVMPRWAQCKENGKQLHRPMAEDATSHHRARSTLSGIVATRLPSSARKGPVGRMPRTA